VGLEDGVDDSTLEHQGRRRFAVDECWHCGVVFPGLVVRFAVVVAKSSELGLATLVGTIRGQVYDFAWLEIVAYACI